LYVRILTTGAEGYLLRITTKKWVDQVFDSAMYYTSAPRKWRQGQTVLFVHKTNIGDAFVGYGILKKTHEKDELSEEERLECEKHGWKKALEFKYVLRFKEPLPIKKTFLKKSKLRGAYLHGLKLDKEQMNSTISQAEGKRHF
jgi:hypothetical protein